MDISAEIAAIQAASQGSELRQPLVGALNKLNTGSLPAVTASDAGKILKVGANGWEVGEKSGYMPVPTATKQITENGTHDVTNYASAVVNVSEQSDFPSGYTRAVCIAGDGVGSYISTGVEPNSNTGVRVLFNGILQSTGATTKSGFLFGSRKGYRNSQYNFVTILSAGTFSYRYDFSDTNSQVVYTPEAILNEVCFNLNGFSFNGVSEQIASAFNGNNLPIFVFCCNTDGAPSQGAFSPFEIYLFEIYNGSNLIMKLLPCVRDSDGEAGFYDVLGQNFYGNIGSGELIAKL